VDTVSYGFRGLPRDKAVVSFSGSRTDALTGSSINPLVTGRSRILRAADSRTKLGLTLPPNGGPLVWTEGPLSALLDLPAELGGVDRLERGEEAARALARRLGVRLAGTEATVRRADLTADVAFERASEGLSVLRAVAGLTLPHCKTEVVHGRASNAVETVTFRNRSGVAVRVYDKSAQRGHRRGRLVRIERQWRPSRAGQVSPAAFAVADHASLFGRPFRSWPLDRLIVANPLDAYFVLKDRIGAPLPGKANGSPRVLTSRIAERLSGTLLWLLAEGDDAWPERRIALERRRELRSVGIEVDNDVDSVVDVGRILFSAVEAWRD
jgi:hypothetical protein